MLFEFHEKLFRNSFIGLSIPVSIFNNGSLGSFEAIVKYVKEEFDLTFREISYILGRDERTIWGAYHDACSKMGSPSKVASGIDIPIDIIKDRSLSILESLTEYLKEVHGLRYCKIAVLLNRDDRTIWTVYKRAKKKRADGSNLL